MPWPDASDYFVRWKLCARGTCTGIVRHRGPRTLARRKFCSTRCARIEAMRLGFRMPAATPEQVRARALRGGAISGQRIRAQAIARAVQRTLDTIPRAILDGFTPSQLAAVRRALVLSEQLGYSRGYRLAEMKHQRHAA